MMFSNPLLRGLMLAAGLLAAAAQAAVRQVPGDHATLQAAVDACAASGDEVAITAPGTYAGTVTITDKNLAISAVVPGVVVSSTITVLGQSNVDLNYLRISGTAFDGVVQGGFGDLRLTSCTLSNNPGRGILQSSPGNVIVTSCTLANNGFDGFNRSTGTATGGTVTFNGPSVVANNSRAGILLENGPEGAAVINGTLLRNNNVGVWAHFAGASVALNGCTFLNNPQDHVLFDVKGAFSASQTTFTHTTAPSFMAGIRFDMAAAATGVTQALIADCSFRAPYPFNCLWLGHRTNLTVQNSSFDGYSSALNVTDNANALSTVVITGTTMRGSTNVLASFNGIDGNPAHTLTLSRSRLIGTATPNNLLNVVATQANITNCVFEGGDVQIWSQGDQARLRALHCTLDGTAITTAGINVLNGNSQHLIANCIINNTRLGLSATTSTLAVPNRNNLVRATQRNFNNVTSGTGTLVNADPQFIANSTGPGTGDYRLQASSPAVDRGDNSLGVTLDYAGQPRDSLVDLGAYEYRTAPVNAARGWALFN